MANPDNPTATKSGQHGTVYFYDNNAAANAVMASMVRLEAARAETQRQAAEDLAKSVSPELIEPISLSIIGAVIAGIGATAAVAGAAAATTSAATGVVSMINQADAGGLSSLEILIENRTATPIVLASYATDESTSSAMPGPLLPGEDGSAVIVSSSDDGWEKSVTTITLNFLVGGGVNANGDLLTPIQANCRLQYNSNGVWSPRMSIDGSGYQTANSKEQAFAAFFSTENDTILDFTIAVIGTEKSSSEVAFQFLPGSSSLD